MIMKINNGINLTTWIKECYKINFLDRSNICKRSKNNNKKSKINQD